MGSAAFDEFVAAATDRVAAMEEKDRPLALAELPKGARS